MIPKFKILICPLRSAVSCCSQLSIIGAYFLNLLNICLQGASIPQCASGTNLLIPLPGAISAEDMAITGANSRLHAQDTPPLSLLYDFEELEGEWDFLSRVVALTFYPTVSGRKPLTLGEVDIFEHIIVDDECWFY